MLSVSRLLDGHLGTQDALRYGRNTARSPAHLLHYSRDKKPVVVWNVTQSCNLHCGHCYANSHDREYPDELTTDEGLRLIGELADFGVPTLLFSGGEPLRRGDLLELAEAAQRAGMRTVLSTNGTLIDQDAAKRIAAAGFSYVGVSFDGIGALHDRIRGKRGAFEDALRGIRNAQRAGLRVGVRFTLHRLNRRDLGAIFDLAEQENVDRLCVYHLAYAGRGDRMRRYDLEPPETRTAVAEIFDRTVALNERGSEIEVLTVDNPVDNVLLLMRVRHTHPERAEEVEQLLRWNGGNQSGIAIACVDPQGRVHPDQFSWDVTVDDVREMLAELEPNLIQSLGAGIQGLHAVGQRLWSRRGAPMASAACNFGTNAFRFNLAKLQAINRLRSFNLEIGQQRLEAFECPQVSGGPRIQRPTVFGRRLGDVQRTAKLRLEHFWDDSRYLSKRHPLTVNWCPGGAKNPHSVSGSFDADCAVTVYRASKISQLRSHNVTYSSEGMSL
ncbi:hypothetical protein LCGC14_1992600 [marine sediment metagenome]|uniref:Radical SAM core domain-containing protein n=1 Tax=marine sediment metagenome TaxID=412755 RepID=A0A0F9F5E0_9ZZZZ